jgi:hypothetical protein
MKPLDYYYAVLGVDLTATPEQLKQAYRDLVKVWHPDRFTNDPTLQSKAEAKLKEINEAYNYLQGVISDKIAATPQPRSKAAEQPQRKPEPTRSAPKENRPQSKKHPYLIRVSRRGVSRIPKMRRVVLIGLGLFFALIIASKFFDMDPETRERVNGANPAFQFEPPASAPERSRTKDTAERQRRMLSADFVKTMKESYDGALRVLTLHEQEKARVQNEYLRRRELFSQGLATRAEVSQAEQALATETAKVDEAKRWLTQAEIAIAEAAVANEQHPPTK